MKSPFTKTASPIPSVRVTRQPVEICERVLDERVVNIPELKDHGNRSNDLITLNISPNFITQGVLAATLRAVSLKQFFLYYQQSRVISIEPVK